MEEISYLDFDLLIERSGEGYRARVLNSPAGQASGDFRLPFSDLELENFLLRVGRTRRGVRGLGSPEAAATKSFGGRLFETVFSDEVRGCLRSSLDEANQQGAGLRIRLRLADTPELADLPWEYLYNPALNRFLSLSVETPLVRYLELPERIRPLTVTPPLRVLVMISSPGDYPPLDVEREWGKLREALGDLEQRGLVALERLEVATLSALQRQLRQAEYHIFHFVGHGGFDEQSQDGVLILEDEKGRGRPVSGQYLGTLLHDERSLRLAVLNACEGARTSRSDPFAGTAQSLVQQGVPAVMAMQFEISDEAAVTLAHEFYAALADGYPVDAALAEARKAIFAQGNEMEWGTPVLYLRAPDGRIFDVERLSDEGRAEILMVASHEQGRVQPVQPPRESVAAQRVPTPSNTRLLWIGGVIGVLILLAFVGLVSAGTLLLHPPSTPQAIELTSTSTKTAVAKTETSVTLTATPKPTSTPTATSPGSQPVDVQQYPFFDDFNGSGLDDHKWAFITGEGQIQVTGGVIRLASAGRTFPVVYSKGNPFPPAGDFQVKVSMRYTSVAERGVGFSIGTSLASYGANQDEDRNALSRGRIVEVWQDSENWHISVGEDNTEIYALSAPDLKTHDIEIQYVDSIYRVRVDGKEVFATAPTALRPSVLWFGNPAQVDAPGVWSSLEIADVAVEPFSGLIVSVTPTPVLPKQCRYSTGDTFAALWQEHRQFLGCPLTSQQTISTIAEEAFQGGHIFWRADTDEVYVVYDREKNGNELFEGEWETHPSWKWDGSDPDGVGLTPPPGLYEPIRGFGWLWRTHLGGADGPLGWALDKEYGFDNTGQVQTFEQGLTFKGSSSKIYALVDNGEFYAR